MNLLLYLVSLIWSKDLTLLNYVIERHVGSTKRGSLSSTIFYNQTRVLKARKRYVVQKKEGTKNGTPLSGRVPA